MEIQTLTPEAIDAMGEGRELDALIAEVVLELGKPGTKTFPIPCPDGRPGCCVAHFSSDWFLPDGTCLPFFSVDIAAALSLVPVMREKGYYFKLTNDFASDMGGPYWCEFATEGAAKGAQDWADTPAQAIVRAALKATLSK